MVNDKTKISKIEMWRQFLIDINKKLRDNPRSRYKYSWINRKMKLEGLIKGYEELEAEVFGLGNALEDYKKENRKLRKECKQWKETCEVLADKKIMKSITKS